MSDPLLGLAQPAWQYGGVLPPAPPCLLFRADGVPFNDDDWYLLDDFVTEMLDDGPRTVSKEDWHKWLTMRAAGHNDMLAVLSKIKSIKLDSALPQLPRSPLVLEAEYRAGDTVRVTGLTGAPELNGMVAAVQGGSNYTVDRIGVQIPGVGVKALKERNLQRCEAQHGSLQSHSATATAQCAKVGCTCLTYSTCMDLACARGAVAVA